MGFGWNKDGPFGSEQGVNVQNPSPFDLSSPASLQISPQLSNTPLCEEKEHKSDTHLFPLLNGETLATLALNAFRPLPLPGAVLWIDHASGCASPTPKLPEIHGTQYLDSDTQVRRAQSPTGGDLFPQQAQAALNVACAILRVE